MIGWSLPVSRDLTDAQVEVWFQLSADSKRGTGRVVMFRVIRSHGVYTLFSSTGGWEGLFQKHADNEKMTHCRHWQRAHSSGPSLLSGFAASAHRAEKGWGFGGGRKWDRGITINIICYTFVKLAGMWERGHKQICVKIVNFMHYMWSQVTAGWGFPSFNNL